MNGVGRRPRRTVVIAAALLVAAAGAAVTGAMAAGAFDPSAERQAYLDDVANRLGVTSSKLQDAMKAAALDRVDAALAAGQITKDQAEAMKDAINSGKLPSGFALPGFGFGHANRGVLMPHGQVIDAAASYLGLSASALDDQLAQGNSLADVANGQGKSVDGLKQAILSAVQSDLDSAVKNGRLTSSQRDQVLSNFKSRLDKLVTTKASGPRSTFGGARGWGGPRFAPGGFHAPSPADAPPAALPTA
jgi:hypothetical protein